MDMSYSNQNHEINRKSENFLNETTHNIVLTELSDDLNKEFHRLLEVNKCIETKEFPMDNIPDLQNKLSSKVKELLS